MCFYKIEFMNIALIAHDGKKPEMVAFAMKNKALLSKTEIFATGTTGKHLEDSGLIVTRFLSGPIGGDAQIAAEVANGKIQAVIFFRDPLDKHPHEPDVNMLMRICDVHNIPLATNPATATLIIGGLTN